jgi:tRNA (guanine10-N2)-dimethyltransferase
MTTRNAYKHIRDRCAYSHMVIQELLQAPLELEEMLTQTKSFPLFTTLSSKQRFAVRIKAIDGAHPFIAIPDLERRIGKIIVEQTGNKVSLDNPDITFYGIFTESVFYFGLLLAKTRRAKIAEQKPSTRPYFKPSSMNPLLARALANLLRVRSQSLILDPFGGTGGLLLEAHNLGAQIIAIELDTKTVAGAKKNLIPYGHVIKADARHLPLRYIAGILTDPPYGRSASTKGVPLPKLVKAFLQDAASILAQGSLLCITFPQHFPFKQNLPTQYFECLEDHTYFVHSSLTRRIYLLRRI